jgi:hypothetical protein
MLLRKSLRAKLNIFVGGEADSLARTCFHTPGLTFDPTDRSCFRGLSGVPSYGPPPSGSWGGYAPPAGPPPGAGYGAPQGSWG